MFRNFSCFWAAYWFYISTVPHLTIVAFVLFYKGVDTKWLLLLLLLQLFFFVIFVVIVIVFVIAFSVAIVAQTFPHLTIVAFVLFHKRGEYRVVSIVIVAIVIIVVFVIFVSSIVIEAFVLFHKRGCCSHKANGQNIDSTISQIMDQSLNDAQNVNHRM